MTTASDIRNITAATSGVADGIYGLYQNGISDPTAVGNLASASTALMTAITAAAADNPVLFGPFGAVVSAGPLGAALANFNTVRNNDQSTSAQYAAASLGIISALSGTLGAGMQVYAAIPGVGEGAETLAAGLELISATSAVGQLTIDLFPGLINNPPSFNLQGSWTTAPDGSPVLTTPDGFSVQPMSMTFTQAATGSGQPAITAVTQFSPTAGVEGSVLI